MWRGRATPRNKQFFTLSCSHQIKCHADITQDSTDGAEPSERDPTAATDGG